MEGREIEKGSKGIGGRVRVEEKENGDRPPAIFGLKVALKMYVTDWHLTC